MYFKNYESFLAEDLKYQFIGMNIKKVRIKIQQYRYFLESNFVGVNRLFSLVYLNKNLDLRLFKTHNHKA